jgi:hypothetical protein
VSKRDLEEIVNGSIQHLIPNPQVHA